MNQHHNINQSSSDDDAFLAVYAQRMGVTLEVAALQLAAAAAPTVADAVVTYLSTVRSPATRSTYALHLRRIVNGVAPICSETCDACMDPLKHFECGCNCSACVESRVSIPALGEMRVSDSTLDQALVAKLAKVAKYHAVKKGTLDNRKRALLGKPSKAADGNNAAQTAVFAARALYDANGKFCDATVAHQVKTPKRHGRDRRAMQSFELAELHYVTSCGGNDPELDTLVLDFVIATGARGKGAVNLTCAQINPITQLIAVKDKYDWQDAMPVSAELIRRLFAHAIARGGERCDPASPRYVADSPVFWIRVAGETRPMTGRRLDTLASRWQASLDWAMQAQIGLHHVRHTMGAILSKRFEPQYKKRYLRHSDTDASSDEKYGKCTTEELASAMSLLLRFDHPLVTDIAARERETLRRLGLL